ncbi:hypothetical protein V502_09109 [Pseudogymnoascus sp. VKM F-4520 (FW-2644)]|nr:hypothetical protein V502_09109 [Pseudogymnoascus sp. VKM F-4520 (FW-2644)]
MLEVGGGVVKNATLDQLLARSRRCGERQPSNGVEIMGRGEGSLKRSLHWLGRADAIPRPRLRALNDSDDDEADKKALNAG